MGHTAGTEPQYLYKGDLYLFLVAIYMCVYIYIVQISIIIHISQFIRRISCNSSYMFRLIYRAIFRLVCGVVCMYMSYGALKVTRSRITNSS